MSIFYGLLLDHSNGAQPYYRLCYLKTSFLLVHHAKSTLLLSMNLSLDNYTGEGS